MVRIYGSRRPGNRHIKQAQQNEEERRLRKRREELAKINDKKKENENG